MKIYSRIYNLFFTERKKALNIIAHIDYLQDRKRKRRISFDRDREYYFYVRELLRAFPRSDFFSDDELYKLSLIHAVNYIGVSSGWSMLHQTCQEGNFEETKFLLDCGANVFRLDENGLCPLSVALRNGHTFIATYLMDYYSAPPIRIVKPKLGNTKSDELFNGKLFTNSTKKEIDAKLNDPNYLTMQLGRDKYNKSMLYATDLKLKYKHQPLWYAVKSKNAECVKEVAVRAFRLLSKDNYYRPTKPVLIAIKTLLEKVHFLKELVVLSYKFSLNYAIKLANFFIVKVLVEAGVPVNVDSRNINWGKIENRDVYPIFTAIKYSRYNIVHYLLCKNAKIYSGVYSFKERKNRNKDASIVNSIVKKRDPEMIKCIFSACIQNNLTKQDELHTLLHVLNGKFLLPEYFDILKILMFILLDFDIEMAKGRVADIQRYLYKYKHVDQLSNMWSFVNGIPLFDIQSYVKFIHSVTLFDSISYKIEQDEFRESLLNYHKNYPDYDE